MGKSIKKLSLNRETVRILCDEDLAYVAGGAPPGGPRKERGELFERVCANTDSCHPDDDVFGGNHGGNT